MVNTIFKRLALITASAAMVLVPIVAGAASDWGPARTIKTYSPGVAGFDHVQFNSFTGTPSYGDERTFFDGKNATNTASGGFADMNNVQDGEELLMRVYVHNNADPSLNGTNFNGTGVAHNTKVRVQLPTGTARSLRANAFISADNANPGTVFDSTDFQTTGGTGFSINYVPGSARISTRGAAEGAQVSDSLVTTGAAVGYNALDGVVPACFQYDLVVSFKVKVSQANVTFQKFVHTPGDSNRLTQMNGLKAGDTVEWVLNYKNETNQTVKNVFVRDQLPAHVTVVPGTVKQYDSNYPNGYQRTDQGIFTGTGISIGDVGPNANGSIKFQTKVNNDIVCGDTPMTNNAWLRADNLPEEGSHAMITATKTGCGNATPPPTPPSTPLPQTGAEGAAAGVFGTGAIGYSLSAYLRSKKSLLDALKR